MIIDAFAGNIFTLVDNVTSNQKVQTVTQTIALQSVARSNIILQSVGNSFVLRDANTVTTPVRVLALADALNLSQTLTKGPPVQDVTTTFFFYQSIDNKGFVDVASSLTFEQTVSGYSGQDIDSLLTLTQSVAYNIVKLVNVSNTLTLTSQQASYEDSSCSCSYGDDPILHSKTVTFSLNSLAVTLRSPEFNNTEKITQNRIMRRSRAGDLIIFRDSQWPATEVLHMDFAYLTSKQSQDLLNFMRETIGLAIKFVDNEQRTWNGFIMTPATQVAEQLRNCFSTTLEFQGNVVPLHVDNVNQRLHFSQRVGFLVDPFVPQHLTFTQQVHAWKLTQNVSQTLNLRFGGAGQYESASHVTTPPVGYVNGDDNQGLEQ